MKRWARGTWFSLYRTKVGNKVGTGDAEVTTASSARVINAREHGRKQALERSDDSGMNVGTVMVALMVGTGMRGHYAAWVAPVPSDGDAGGTRMAQPGHKSILVLSCNRDKVRRAEVGLVGR